MQRSVSETLKSVATLPKVSTSWSPTPEIVWLASWNSSAMPSETRMAANLSGVRVSGLGDAKFIASYQGLLPTWNSTINASLVKQFGFTHNAAAAKTLLQNAGYKVDGSGMFLNKDGSKIDLEIAVPQGSQVLGRDVDPPLAHRLDDERGDIDPLGAASESRVHAP